MVTISFFGGAIYSAFSGMGRGMGIELASMERLGSSFALFSSRFFILFCLTLYTLQCTWGGGRWQLHIQQHTPVHRGHLKFGSFAVATMPNFRCSCCRQNILEQ